MSLVVNLDKLSKGIAVNLEKRVADTNNFPNDINVTLALDVSGSMHRPFHKGDVLHALQRVVAVSNVIDDDGILNFYCFSDVGIPQDDIEAEKDFVNLERIVNRIANSNGTEYWNGTYFAPVLRDIVAEHSDGGTRFVTTVKKVIRNIKPTGFMAKMKSWFSGTTPTETVDEVVKTPVEVEGDTKQLVILITDGDNFDASQTASLFKDLQGNKQFYFQCIGVGCSNSFLRKCSEQYSNVGYTELSSFTEDDDALANALVSDEVLRHFGY